MGQLLDYPSVVLDIHAALGELAARAALAGDHGTVLLGQLGSLAVHGNTDGLDAGNGAARTSRNIVREVAGHTNRQTIASTGSGPRIGSRRAVCGIDSRGAIGNRDRRTHVVCLSRHAERVVGDDFLEDAVGCIPNRLHIVRAVHAVGVDKLEHELLVAVCVVVDGAHVLIVCSLAIRGVHDIQVGIDVQARPIAGRDLEVELPAHQLREGAVLDVGVGSLGCWYTGARQGLQELQFVHRVDHDDAVVLRDEQVVPRDLDRLEQQRDIAVVPFDAMDRRKARRDSLTLDGAGLCNPGAIVAEDLVGVRLDPATGDVAVHDSPQVVLVDIGTEDLLLPQVACLGDQGGSLHQGVAMCADVARGSRAPLADRAAVLHLVEDAEGDGTMTAHGVDTGLEADVLEDAVSRGAPTIAAIGIEAGCADDVAMAIQAAVIVVGDVVGTLDVPDARCIDVVGDGLVHARDVTGEEADGISAGQQAVIVKTLYPIFRCNYLSHSFLLLSNLVYAL